ncbi:DUF2934 domain-containing protein [Marivivens marinus]|uniref:DUF2934 domain-containing protein n=1 Tax=Marivivens marinus TaxID=3110173 RepID=UPI003B847071
MTTQTIPTDQIAEAAYHIWMAEGCPAGRDQDHWLAAEAQLTTTKPAPKKRAAAKKAAPKATEAKAPAKPRARKAAAKTA